MEVLYRPAIQLPSAGSTSAEDTDDGTDDDGNIKGGCLKRQSCRANMANRLKSVIATSEADRTAAVRATCSRK